MLTLQITGIKSKTKDNTGYYVRSPIQKATPANFTSTSTRLISISDYNDTQAKL